MNSTVRYGAHRDQVAEVTAPVRQTGRAPLVLLLHGDQAVPVAMSRRCQLASGAQLLELPGADHFDLIDHRSAAWASVVGVLRRLLE